MKKKYINLPDIRGQKIRKKYYCTSAVKHPAKADIPMMIWILTNFVKDGDIVLDPMAGIGGTLIEGMRLFPNSLFLGVELEEKFVKWTNASIKKTEKIAREDWFMKVGKAICVQGDARQLAKVLKEKVNKIITSPPFGQAQSGGGIAKKGYTGSKHSPTDLIGKRSYMPENTGKDEKNISNLPYVDKVISSPPYEGVEASLHKSKFKNPEKFAEISSKRFREGKKKGHFASKEAILRQIQKEEKQYSSNKNNIGNTKGQTYLSEMLIIYQQCYKVLKSGSLMILILKDFIRKGKRIPLGEDTIRLCQMAGFEYIKTYYRKIEHPSFWRILQIQKYGEAYRIDAEDILVFKKLK